MRHEDGISVVLKNAHDGKIPELDFPIVPANLPDPTSGDKNDKRCVLRDKGGTAFAAEITMHDKFDYAGEECLQVSVAVGHTEWSYHNLTNVQSWHVPANTKIIKINEKHCWGETSEGKWVCPLTIPEAEPYDFTRIPSDEWNDLGAPKGCIVVYIVRGKLTGETRVNRPSYITDPPEHVRDQVAGQVHPIRFEWVEGDQDEGSTVGEPYIFSFWNIDSDVVEAMGLQQVREG